MQEISNLVTVIIANYNYGRFIAESIQSVAGQTHANLELIVVDDGSTDNSRQEIGRALAEIAGWSVPLRAIYLDKNLGFNGAVNSASRIINGHYVVLLDSDDRLKPEYVSTMLKAMHAEEPNGVGIVYGHSHLIDEGGNIIGELQSEKFDPELLDHKSYIPGNALTSMAAFETALPLDENIRKAIKWNRWRLIIGNGFSGFYVKEPLFEYRMHDQNASGIGDRLLPRIADGERGFKAVDYWPTGNLGHVVK